LRTTGCTVNTEPFHGKVVRNKGTGKAVQLGKQQTTLPLVTAKGLRGATENRAKAVKNKKGDQGKEKGSL